MRQVDLRPTLHVFRYNVQSVGDELYGIEPIANYIEYQEFCSQFQLRGFIVGPLFLPLSLFLRLSGKILWTSLILVISSIYLWLAIVVPRPHKEERFLFSVYPALVVPPVVVAQQVWDVTFFYDWLVKIGGNTHEFYSLLTLMVVKQSNHPTCDRN